MAADQVIAFLVFSFVAAVTPGPSNLMLTATGAAAGFARGLPCLAGVAAGMGALMFAVALGLGGLVVGHPLAMRVLNFAGAAFLLWLAFRIATARPAEAGVAAEPVGFMRAAAFQWVNPKSWLVSASAAATYLHGDGGAASAHAFAFAGVFLAAMLPSGALWLAFGAAMQRWLATPRAARRFNLAMGAALAASVAFILR